jgi:hypothetical protein
LSDFKTSFDNNFTAKNIGNFYHENFTAQFKTNLSFYINNATDLSNIGNFYYANFSGSFDTNFTAKNIGNFYLNNFTFSFNNNFTSSFLSNFTPAWATNFTSSFNTNLTTLAVETKINNTIQYKIDAFNTTMNKTLNIQSLINDTIQYKIDTFNSTINTTANIQNLLTFQRLNLSTLNVSGALNVSNFLFVNLTNVGIGVVYPTYNLTIVQSSAALNVSGMLYVNSTNVGIGTATPTAPLQVLGNVLFGGDSEADDYMIKTGGYFGYISTGAKIGVHVPTSLYLSDAASSASYKGIYSNPGMTDYYIGNTRSGDFEGVVGSPVFVSGASSSTTLTGKMIGIRGSPTLYTNAGATITASNAMSLYASNPTKGGAGAAGATITNVYGLYIEDITAGGTLNYSIYSVGGTNYFGGKIGIGTATPSNTLDVRGIGNFSGTVYINNATDLSNIGNFYYVNFSGSFDNNFTAKNIGNFYYVNFSGSFANNFTTPFKTNLSFYINNASNLANIGNFYQENFTAQFKTNLSFYINNASNLANIGNFYYVNYSSSFTNNLTAANLYFGTTTSGGLFEFEDGSVCIGGYGGCTAPSLDGRLLVNSSITVGSSTTSYAYNSFGIVGVVAGPIHTAAGEIQDTSDVYIGDDLEVDGEAWLAGGSTTSGVYWTAADIAENIQSKESRQNKICNGDVGCLINNTKEKIEYGSLVCIDTSEARTIKLCDKANSQLAVGVVSDTAVLTVGRENGYPIALAGIVLTFVTNENGNVNPGDLLVSSSIPGYAMKNNNPKDGTVVGKAFDFCDKKECRIAVFVALS